MFNFLSKTKLLHQISPVLNRVILALISCYLSLMRYMNLLVCGLKLEASSLIYQKHLIRCSMNLLNLLQDFLKEKNAQPSTGKSLNGKISILEYLRFPFMFLYFFSFTLMILKKVSLPMQSYLQIILLCFLLCMTLKHLQMISIKIRKQ